MRKWLLPAIFIITAAIILTYFVANIPNPFKRYDHSQGIAYFKQGPISIFPYEMDASKMPFNITAAIQDQRISDQGIFVYQIGKDSAEVEFKIRNTIYRYTQKLDEEFSNGFFSSCIHLTGIPQPPNYRGLYYFKLLRTIGFYVLDSKKASSRSLGDACPFNVVIISKASAILNVPVLIKLLSDDLIFMGFSMDGHDYTETFKPGSIIRNQYFSIRVYPYVPVTQEQKRAVYLFKFER